MWLVSWYCIWKRIILLLRNIWAMSMCDITHMSRQYCTATYNYNYGADVYFIITKIIKQSCLIQLVGNWKKENNIEEQRHKIKVFHCTWFLTCRTYLGSTECSFLSGCQQHGSPWALERLEPWSEPRSYACRWSFWGWGRSLPGSGCLHHALQTDKGRGNFVHTIPRNSKQNIR